MEVFENLDLDKLLYGQALLSLLTSSFLPNVAYNVAIFLFGLSSLEAASTNRLRQFMAILVMSILIDVLAVSNAPDETSSFGSFLVVINMFLKFLSSWATLGSLRAREQSTFGGNTSAYAPLHNDWRGSGDAPSLRGDFMNPPPPPLPNKQAPAPTPRYTDLDNSSAAAAASANQRPTTGLANGGGTAGPPASAFGNQRPTTGGKVGGVGSGVGGNDIRVEGYHTIE